MPHYNYQFLKVSERNTRGNKYLVAEFQKDNKRFRGQDLVQTPGATSFGHHKTVRQMLDLISLEYSILDIATNGEWEVSKSDFNELTRAVKSLKAALDGDPEAHIDWWPSGKPKTQKSIVERISQHNKKCVELLQSDNINKQFSVPKDYEFGNIPVPE